MGPRSGQFGGVPDEAPVFQTEIVGSVRPSEAPHILVKFTSLQHDPESWRMKVGVRGVGSEIWIVLHFEHKGGRGREAQLKEAVSHSCHNVVLKTPLSRQQQAVGREQCLGVPSGCAPRRWYLGTGCATPVSHRDGVGPRNRHGHAHGC